MRSRPRSLFLVAGLVSALSLAPARARAAAPPGEVAGEVARDLDPYVTQALATWKVPGAAIAIVKDGRVVLARGFGVRAAGRPERVDEHTSFAIASLSKGFTAAALGLLVEEGRLGWDDPVVRHWPGFAVADPTVTRELTIRDLLAHRSGLGPESDALWSYAGYGREEILARLRFLGQGAGLRASFSYQNVLYLVAGEVLAARSGQRWEEFVATRLLAPLDMCSSSTSGKPLPGSTNVAQPHSDTGDPPEARPIQAEDSTPVSPAAALHSSAADLAHWLLMLLDRGQYAGRRVLQPATVDALFTPQMLIDFEPALKALYPESHFQAYGLGWVVQDYRGRLVVWNTGGLHGMACSTALIPEERLGVVVLTNGPRISLPEALVFRVLDGYLGAGPPAKDWSGLRLKASLARRARLAEAERAAEAARVRGTRPTLSLERYAGVYEQPLLGRVTVSPPARDGRVTLQVARGLVGDLSHWHYDTFRIVWRNPLYGTSLATFALDPNGAPSRLFIEELGDFRREKAGEARTH
ncbi:MAG TPA: serine hydrolase [Polyangia bacterium]|jgi:CubicO group peptidase (beta-lactamase class C family)|nr:serine hydrolase [Polyangia bacterium]